MASGLRIELYVDDLARAQEFYERVLGFETWKSDGEYRAMTLEGNRLALQSITELDANHHLRRASGERGLGVEVVLEVSNLGALAARVDAAGWDRTVVASQPWGLSDFRVVDPDSYYLRITEAK